MSCEDGGSIHYTFNGDEPTERSTLYDKPVWIFKSSTLKARVYKKGYHQSMLKSISYDFVKPKINGVSWKLFKGPFKKVPDIRKVKAVKVGTSFNISFDSFDVPSKNFAISFTGYIDIVKDGVYTLYISSNDGSKLYVNNKLLVDNDGEHGATERSANIKLTKGKHAVKVDYFQSGGGKMLQVYYKGPGIARRVIPGSVLYLKK